MTDHLSADLEDRVRDAYQSAARTVQPHTLQQTSPALSARSVSRPRRMNAFAPIAAAMAVVVVIGAIVALPRLLTGAAGSSPTPATRGISAPAPGPPPPFRVVVAVSDFGNRKASLLVESGSTGHVENTLAPPWPGGTWADVSATADTTKFIVAAAPIASPYAPVRLYTLTLSAHGKVTRLTPLAVPTLPGEITSLAASADGSTVAYTTEGPGAVDEAGVIAHGRERHWSVFEGAFAAIFYVSVSGDGGTLAFVTQSIVRHGIEDTAWVLPTDSAPGSLTARAKKIYDHTHAYGPGQAATLLESALISPDGNTLFVTTAAMSASGRTVTAVTASSTANGASLGTISTWNGGSPTMLSPVGGMLLSWNPLSSAAYLINPATRARTALRLPRIPHASYSTLAW